MKTRTRKREKIEKTGSKTTRIERDGHSVSITQVRVNGSIYYQVKATILGQRKCQSAKTAEAAEKKAHALLAQLKAKGGMVATYTPAQVAVIEQALKTCEASGVTLTKAVGDYAEAAALLPAGTSLTEAVRRFAQLHRKQEREPIPFDQAKKEYLDTLEKKKTGELHQRTQRLRLDKAAQHFRCNVGDITSKDIESWVHGLDIGPLTANHYRAAIAALFRFCQRKGYLEREGKTEADFTEKATTRKQEVEAYTPDQAAHLLAAVEDRWRPYVAFGLFAGLRQRELFRLDWKSVKDSHVEVAGSIAKTGRRRIVPILPALQAWMETFPNRIGPIAPTFTGGDASRAQSLSQTLRNAAKSGGFKIINNGLRHSFISYRVADLQNRPQTSLEAGNSPDVIAQHYDKVATAEEAKRFFLIRPPRTAKNVIHTSFAA